MGKRSRKRKIRPVVELGATADDSEGDDSLQINTEFAAKFERVQRERKDAQERSRLERVVHAQLREEEDRSDSESESEDEDGKYLTADLDKQILKTIVAIKKRDEAIYSDKPLIRQPEEDAAHEEGDSASGKKTRKPAKFTVKDLLLEDARAGGGDESDSDTPAKPTYHEEQAKLKAAFKSEAARLLSDDSSGEDEDFVRVKPGGRNIHPESAAKAAADPEMQQYVQEAYKSDEFLQKFVLNEWWREKDPSKLPSYKEITGEDEPEQPDVSEDEEYLDELDRFEAKYNFRFEEEGANEIVTYPRNIDNSVRQKDSKRGEARERRRKRKEEMLAKKAEEIKRLKNNKKKEIMGKLTELAQITGAAGEEFFDLDLTKDFDPTAYDNAMKQIFDDEFYEQEEEGVGAADLNDDGTVNKKALGLTEDDDPQKALKPFRFLNESKKKLKAAGKSEISQKLDELFKLDYEDVIGGDTPCRFNYVQVPKADYGLTAEQILTLSDKELNQIISLKKMAPYREKNKQLARRWGADLPGAAEHAQAQKNAADAQSGSGKKKRRRRRKRGREEAAEADAGEDVAAAPAPAAKKPKPAPAAAEAGAPQGDPANDDGEDGEDAAAKSTKKKRRRKRKRKGAGAETGTAT